MGTPIPRTTLLFMPKVINITMKSIRDYINLIENAQREGVAEGLAKNIKRTVQGWRKDEPTPQSIKKRADQYTDDELKALASEYDDLRSVRLSAGLSPERPKHSPEGLQKRLIDRKMKKRGLKEQGVAEEQLEETSPEAIAKIAQITRK